MKNRVIGQYEPHGHEIWIFGLDLDFSYAANGNTEKVHGRPRLQAIYRLFKSYLVRRPLGIARLEKPQSESDRSDHEQAHDQAHLQPV
ncbi:hypothetical protein BFL28_03645 [Sphingomonas turrisvirgatae]|uniref:Uncharacterized protein n=1 Tax=Sphingomonas turrisvirgatae TaxID=1888892 RepID=A0A1E3LSV0_9SPHN|nr:hypothetical protein BFL28_03645 [Sphingomonas turrisvirgatae]